jgi:hypothetical protein
VAVLDGNELFLLANNNIAQAIYGAVSCDALGFYGGSGLVTSECLDLVFVPNTIDFIGCVFPKVYSFA